MKKVLMGLAALSMSLMGCAVSSSSSISKQIRPVDNKANSEIGVIGMERAKALGPVFFREEDECSEVNLLKYASTKFPDMDDVINIRMEETRLTANGRVTKFQCKYYGLAVSYTSLEKEDAEKWVEIRNQYENHANPMMLPPHAPAPEKKAPAPNYSEPYSEVEAQ